MKTLYPAIAAFALSVIAKMLYYIRLAPNEEFDMYVRFFYLLVFLLALFIGIQNRMKSFDFSFTEGLKQGMRIASFYALLLAAFTWVYYRWIDTSYFQVRIQEVRESAAQANAEQMDAIMSNAEIIFSPSTHSTLTLLGLMCIGFIYSIILSLIIRKVKPSF